MENTATGRCISPVALTLEKEILQPANSIVSPSGISNCRAEAVAMTSSVSLISPREMKFLSGECHRTPLVICQHCFRCWLAVEMATSHYLSRYWPRIMSTCGITRSQWFYLGSCGPGWTKQVLSYNHLIYISLINGNEALKWKLHCHWLIGLWQRQIAVVTQGLPLCMPL